MNDLKFALRQLLKNPGFTAVAVLSTITIQRWRGCILLQLQPSPPRRLRSPPRNSPFKNIRLCRSRRCEAADSMENGRDLSASSPRRLLLRPVHFGDPT